MSKVVIPLTEYIEGMFSSIFPSLAGRRFLMIRCLNSSFRSREISIQALLEAGLEISLTCPLRLLPVAMLRQPYFKAAAFFVPISFLKRFFEHSQDRERIHIFRERPYLYSALALFNRTYLLSAIQKISKSMSSLITFTLRWPVGLHNLRDCPYQRNSFR